MDAHVIPTVGELMSPGPIMISQDEGLAEAVRLLEDHEIAGMPVVDGDGALVGVLSESDLIRARATESLWRDWPILTVRHLMHSPALTADLAMGIDEAARLMEEAHVHRLVVIDRDQVVPVGVLSMSDVVRAISWERDDEH
jgi:CBS domain-containing protein